MNPVTGLSVGRVAIGALAIARPDLAAQSLKLDATSNPSLPVAVRMFGSRELALGLITLVSRGTARRNLVLAGIVVDATDAAAGYLAISDRSVTKRTGLGLVAPALGAVVSGVLGLRPARQA